MRMTDLPSCFCRRTCGLSLQRGVLSQEISAHVLSKERRRLQVEHVDGGQSEVEAFLHTPRCIPVERKAPTAKREVD